MTDAQPDPRLALTTQAELAAWYRAQPPDKAPWFRPYRISLYRDLDGCISRIDAAAFSGPSSKGRDKVMTCLQPCLEHMGTYADGSPIILCRAMTTRLSAWSRRDVTGRGVLVPRVRQALRELPKTTYKRARRALEREKDQRAYTESLDDLAAALEALEADLKRDPTGEHAELDEAAFAETHPGTIW